MEVSRELEPEVWLTLWSGSSERNLPGPLAVGCGAAPRALEGVRHPQLSRGGGRPLAQQWAALPLSLPGCPALPVYLPASLSAFL